MNEWKNCPNHRDGVMCPHPAHSYWLHLLQSQFIQLSSQTKMPFVSAGTTTIIGFSIRFDGSNF